MQGKPIQKKRPDERKLPPGISVRHSRLCATRDGKTCNCSPAIRAFVYDRRSRAKVRKTFATLSAAKAWRAAATTQLNDGKRIGASRVTLRQAAEAWLAGAEADPPTVLTRAGRPYKPSVLRGYRHDLQQHVLPDFGAARLSDVRRGDLQALVDRMIGKGLSGSKVRNAIVAVRVVYRHALERDLVAANPTVDLRVPNGSKPRDRAASAAEAVELLAALPADIRPIYATAFYAGLRRGELRGLRWDDVDLAAGVIHVRRGWDDVAGEIEPKSAKGTRTVPLVAVLRDELTELKAAGSGGEFVFGSKHGQPFTPSNIRKRSASAWAAENARRAKRKRKPLAPIGLHECRHTFVSLMHDAGLSLERIGDYVGHSSAYMTDRYRHLLEGHEAEAARLLDDYLARADAGRRRAPSAEAIVSPTSHVASRERARIT
jgi:integrase